MTLTRRSLLALAGASTALAQTPTPAPDTAKPDPVAKAREENRRGAETLAKFEVPMSTEPAFIFRP
jgi:hypothetical protein